MSSCTTSHRKKQSCYRMTCLKVFKGVCWVQNAHAFRGFVELDLAQRTSTQFGYVKTTSSSSGHGLGLQKLCHETFMDMCATWPDVLGQRWEGQWWQWKCGYGQSWAHWPTKTNHGRPQEAANIGFKSKQNHWWLVPSTSFHVILSSWLSFDAGINLSASWACRHSLLFARGATPFNLNLLERTGIVFVCTCDFVLLLPSAENARLDLLVSRLGGNSQAVRGCNTHHRIFLNGQP